MNLLSIDPGIRGSGVALFSAGKLVACAYIKNLAKTGAGPAECASMARVIYSWVIRQPGSDSSVDELVVEWPRVYQRGGGKTHGQDPNDLRALCGVGGALAMVAKSEQAKVECVEPSVWKGQATKEAIAERVKLRLDEKERMVLLAEAVPKSLMHNVIDAVGIGLWAVGRFERKRVLARE